MKTIKSIIVFVLSAALLAGGALAADTPSGWAKAEVEAATEQGFVPEELLGDYQAGITREEYAKLILSMLIHYEIKFRVSCGLEGFAEADTLEESAARLGALLLSEKHAVREYRENVFADTNHPLINWAYALRLINGRGDGTFGPDDNITRQEMAALMLNTFLMTQQTAIKHGPKAGGFAAVMTDQNDMACWASDAVMYMYEWDIMKGTSAITFDPLGACPREQAVIITARLYKFMQSFISL